jgi:hypothetical protein
LQYVIFSAPDSLSLSQLGGPSLRATGKTLKRFTPREHLEAIVLKSLSFLAVKNMRTYLMEFGDIGIGK